MHSFMKNRPRTHTTHEKHSAWNMTSNKRCASGWEIIFVVIGKLLNFGLELKIHHVDQAYSKAPASPLDYSSQNEMMLKCVSYKELKIPVIFEIRRTLFI